MIPVVTRFVVGTEAVCVSKPKTGSGGMSYSADDNISGCILAGVCMLLLSPK